MKLLFVLVLCINLIFAYQPSGLLNSVPTNKKIVFLTFDDGPLPEVTNQLLDILASENVKATFFLIGNNIIKYPDLVEKIYLAGHEIGNHSYNHIRLDNLFGDNLRFEIEETNNLIKDILGFKPRFFRPPGGRFNNIVYEAVRNNNLISLGWVINASDYLDDNRRVMSEIEIDSKLRQIMSNLHGNLKPGAVILMHNGNKLSVRAVQRVIKYVHDSGYQFKKLSDYL